MFDPDRRYDEEYTDPAPVRERRRIGWRDVTPMWALPLLLIPLALLVWGGSLLLRNNANTNNNALTREAATTRQSTPRPTGTQVGVGGSGDTGVTSTPAAKLSPTPRSGVEAGVGGGPDDTVPGTPRTGHGW